MERHVDHLKSNRLFSNEQNGFLSKQLWIEDSRLHMDIQKAFNTVPH